MNLIEVFSLSDLSKYQYDVISKSQSKEVYQFALNDGQRFTVKFDVMTTPESSDIYYQLLKMVQRPERLHDPAIVKQIYDKWGGIYHVTFQDADREEGDFEQTGKNKDMFFIIGHVTKIIMDFAIKHKILELSFASEGEEVSRVKLYDRMSKVIPIHTNLKLSYVERDPDFVTYIFVKK